jgi:hypothetical protein
MIYHADQFGLIPMSEFINNENNFFVVYHELIDEHGNGSPVGHWTCFIMRDNEKVVEYFDSFGKDTPVKPLKLVKFFKQNGYKVSFFKKRLQSFTTANCGKFVVLRIRSQHLDNSKFLDIFANKKLSGDELAMSLVSLNF